MKISTFNAYGLMLAGGAIALAGLEGGLAPILVPAGGVVTAAGLGMWHVAFRRGH